MSTLPRGCTPGKPRTSPCEVRGFFCPRFALTAVLPGSEEAWMRVLFPVPGLLSWLALALALASSFTLTEKTPQKLWCLSSFPGSRSQAALFPGLIALRSFPGFQETFAASENLQRPSRERGRSLRPNPRPFPRGDPRFATSETAPGSAGESAEPGAAALFW